MCIRDSPDGVDEDMATLVLDNTALGPAEAPRSEPGSGTRPTVPYDFDPASDAAIMLRVAAGDESSFNYLVGKYNRAMIHFLFRMVRNQAVAEELAQDVFLRVYRSRESSVSYTHLDVYKRQELHKAIAVGHHL